MNETIWLNQRWGFFQENELSNSWHEYGSQHCSRITVHNIVFLFPISTRGIHFPIPLMLCSVVWLTLANEMLASMMQAKRSSILGSWACMLVSVLSPWEKLLQGSCYLFSLGRRMRHIEQNRTQPTARQACEAEQPIRSKPRTCKLSQLIDTWVWLFVMQQ